MWSLKLKSILDNMKSDRLDTAEGISIGILDRAEEINKSVEHINEDINYGGEVRESRVEWESLD